MSLRFSLLAGLALAFAPSVVAQNATPLADGGPTTIVFPQSSSAVECGGTEAIGETGLAIFYRNYADTEVSTGQSFTAPCDGQMDEYTMTIYSLASAPAPEEAGTFVFTLVAGAGGAGEVLATQEFTFDQPAATNTATPRVLELNDDFVVTEGEIYTVFFVQTASGFQIIGTDAPSYGGGDGYVVTGDITGATSPAVATNGSTIDFTFNLTFAPALVAADGGPEGAAVAIGTAVPNPSASSARLPFTLEAASDVRLAVYDVLGRQVAVLADGTYASGSHEATLDASALSAGTYIARLQAGDTVVTRTFSVSR